MEFLFPVLVIGGIAVWISDLRRRGEPVGPAVQRAVRRWGPVLLVAYLAYTVVGVLAAILSIGLLFLLIWAVVGAFTGGFLWTDASAAEAFNGFGIFILVVGIAAVVAFVALLVLLVRMIFRRLGEMNHESPGAAPVVAASPPAPVPPPPPPPVLAPAPPPPPPAPSLSPPPRARASTATRSRPAPARATRTRSRTPDGRRRPLRAPGR